MDLENELRQAMAEHVTEVSAGRTLADEARRRHHRTVRRRTAVAMTAAGLVVAVAAIPAYKSFRPQTVGADGPEGHHGSRSSAAPSLSVSASPHDGARSTTPAPDATVSRTPGTPAQRPSSPRLNSTVKALLGYLPPGIDPDKTCTTENAGSRATTTCRWTGTAGWIEVRLVRDPDLKAVGEMDFAPAIVSHVKVNGHPALRADSPAPSQLTWVEHSGLGVWVGVSPSLSDRLVRIAEGVHAT